jgi:hypothetical protein
MAYSIDQAKERVTGYTTPKYGRGPNTDQEWQTIAQGINYDDGIDDAELQTAYGNADKLAMSYGAQPQAPAAPAAPPPPPNTVPVPSNLQSTVGNLFQQQPASPIQSAYQDSLLSVLNRAQQPVSIADPSLQPVSDTHRLGMQRTREREQARIAEGNAATGGGGFATDRAGERLRAQEGRTNAEFDANLVKGELDARRGQLMQALSLAQSTGNAEAARQLQTQLALLQESVGESQFGRELGFREEALGQQGRLGMGELALRLMGLMQGNQYNYDVLGSNNAFNLANLNQRSIQDLLGAL